MTGLSTHRAFRGVAWGMSLAALWSVIASSMAQTTAPQPPTPASVDEDAQVIRLRAEATLAAQQRAGAPAPNADTTAPPQTPESITAASPTDLSSSNPDHLPLRSIIATPDAPRAASTVAPGGAWMWRTAAALAVVVGLIFGLRAVVLRLSGQRMAGSQGGLVEVLARTTIGPRTQIVFLKIHQRIIIAAQTPSGLTTLDTIQDAEQVAWLLAEVEASRPRSITNGFRHMLSRADATFDAGMPVDSSEHVVDRTREAMSKLASRIRGIGGRHE